MAGVLYLVSTPIGNLEDITVRALNVLRAVDGIVCERLSVTRILLQHYEIKKPIWECNDHTSTGRIESTVQKLLLGKSLAMVSDAGTPLVSDPGYGLVRACYEKNITVTAVPGPSSVLTALALSGLPMHRFVFAGFLQKTASARRTDLTHFREHEETLVFFESPLRLNAFLHDALAVLGDRTACVLRELTKKFEERRFGLLSTLQTAEAPRGEIVVVVSGASHTPAPLDQVRARLSEFGPIPGRSTQDQVMFLETVPAFRGVSKRVLYKLLCNKPLTPSE